jgi:LuxR family maltose regulon positive regulatory protein
VLRFSDSLEARQHGIKLFDAMLKYCDDLQIYGIKIEVYCLKALLLAGNEDLDGALASLKQAMEAGEPEGYVRTFVDLGQQMAGLLKQAVEHDIQPEYASFLLTQFEQPDKLQADHKPQQDLIEPLSDRELEVLSLLTTHLSGPEIAAQLHISHNTFKTHTKNIYGKLEVQSRNQAVKNARELGLL